MDKTQLRELLDYSPDTGIFLWKKDRYCVKKGDVAGCKNGKGYITITINYKYLLAHRLAFLYMNGELPELGVDHINGVKDDNRWCNLREADSFVNGKNMPTPISNTSGHIGIRWESGKWRARIKVNNKLICLGRYRDKVKAIEVRKDAERKYGFHENHGRKS